MKAIVMSIKPKWVAKILNGEKTIEIRKTMPKCDLPIDVYIYCTKDKENNLHKNRNGWFANEMNVIFVEGKPIYENYNGKVVAKFTLNKVEEINKYQSMNPLYTQPACLAVNEWCDYLGEKVGYAWHISKLEIFDKPKELSEFKPYSKYPTNHRVKRPTQSWCYIKI